VDHDPAALRAGRIAQVDHDPAAPWTTPWPPLKGTSPLAVRIPPIVTTSIAHRDHP
jgi:hypothetical protein